MTTAVVLYESMFGNTRRIAEAIGEGLATYVTVRVGAVADEGRNLAGTDLVVVGAPTHAHSLPRSTSREEAARWARDPEQHLEFEANADATGVREWIESLDAAPGELGRVRHAGRYPAHLRGRRVGGDRESPAPSRLSTRRGLGVLPRHDQERTRRW